MSVWSKPTTGVRADAARVIDELDGFLPPLRDSFLTPAHSVAPPKPLELGGEKGERHGSSEAPLELFSTPSSLHEGRGSTKQQTHGSPAGPTRAEQPAWMRVRDCGGGSMARVPVAPPAPLGLSPSAHTGVTLRAFHAFDRAPRSA